MSERRAEYRVDVMVTITWPLQDVVDLAVGIGTAADHWRAHVVTARYSGQDASDAAGRAARYDELYRRLSQAIAGTVQ